MPHRAVPGNHFYRYMFAGSTHPVVAPVGKFHDEPGIIQQEDDLRVGLLTLFINQGGVAFFAIVGYRPDLH